MGLRDDLERFKDVGEEHRMDLEEFIQHGQMGEDIKIPIKIVDLPEFVYAQKQRGTIGQAGEDEDPEVGDPVEFPEQPGEGDEAGDEPGEHGHYEMDPEEFAEEMDEEFDLNLEPKGKEVIEETIGDMVEVSRAGPRSALDVDYLFTEGLKRKLALWYDEPWIREVCKIEGFDAQDVFEYTRSFSIPIGLAAVEELYDETRKGKPEWSGGLYESVEDFESHVRDPIRSPPAKDIDRVPIRREDERYRHPEVIEEKQKNVVVVNIRDVSGSMRDSKRDLVERVFTPMDWYLQGKYEHAEHRYIAHDSQAWEVERAEFFGIRSGGGTRVSSAYKLAKEILDEYYPWDNWNRYVFGAGDGENSTFDSEEELAPAIHSIDANLHAYIEVEPRRSDVIEPLNSALSDDEIVTAQVNNKDDVIPAIKKILRAASEESQEDEQ